MCIVKNPSVDRPVIFHLSRLQIFFWSSFMSTEKVHNKICIAASRRCSLCICQKEIPGDSVFPGPDVYGYLQEKPPSDEGQRGRYSLPPSLALRKVSAVLLWLPDTSYSGLPPEKFLRP